MYYIALQMLFGDRTKFITMIVGVSFAALIMTQQPSIFVGLLTRTYSFVNDMSEPDIWVMDPGVQFVEESKPMRDVELLKVRGVYGVKWAVPISKNLLRAKMPDGELKTVDVTGIDDATLIGAPYNIIEGNITDFRRADAIFMDKNAAETRLRVKIDNGQYRSLQVGDIIEINDKRAVIVGLIESTRNFVLQPQIFTTYSNALNYAFPSRKQLGYILVKAREGMDHRSLAKNITRATDLAAYTAEDFKQINLDYWMKNTGIPINFGISVLLGFIVGAAIAGQTFYGFVMENLKHYAVLRAMGATNYTLTMMVLLQAIVVGFIGYGIGVGITTIFGIQMSDSVLAFRMPYQLLIFAATGVLLIISTVAFLGIKKVISVDPSDVFRR